MRLISAVSGVQIPASPPTEIVTCRIRSAGFLFSEDQNSNSIPLHTLATHKRDGVERNEAPKAFFLLHSSGPLFVLFPNQCTTRSAESCWQEGTTVFSQNRLCWDCQVQGTAPCRSDTGFVQDASEREGTTVAEFE